MRGQKQIFQVKMMDRRRINTIRSDFSGSKEVKAKKMMKTSRYSLVNEINETCSRVRREITQGTGLPKMPSYM